VTTSQYYNGVYLKWRLPDALTQGAQDNAKGRTIFPRVPNRWLIVRYNGPVAGRAAAAWIVESDYLWANGALACPQNVSQVGSLYVQPQAPGNNTPASVYMGQSVPLATTPWQESGHTLHLTALAPGNPAFAFYQPT